MQGPNINIPISKYPKILPEITIREHRFERTGYTFWKADSLPLNSVIPLSDRLLWENVLDVRANAPGTLTTLSVRGVGSARTPVFWNGLNLQSPMNGVLDASLLPLWPDDHLEIHYGGQSAAQSSGAMGGSVVIAQGEQNFSGGFSGFINTASGSFGRWEGSTGAGYSGKKIATKVRVAVKRADNNFDFKKQGLDGKFYPARQVNNYLQNLDLQQFNQYKINEKNSLKSALWLQDAFRELPPSTTEAPRETWQRDQASRALLTWEHAPNTRTFWTTRAALLNDFLAFHLAGDTDTSRSRQLLMSTERSASIGKQWAWRAGTTALRQWAQVDGYSDSLQWFGQTRLAGYVMGEWIKGNARLSTLLRQEWAQGQATPFNGSLGGQVGLAGLGKLKFHFSRNFNLPTLNDRYWKNLGKADLRPEKGYSADLSWALQHPDFSTELTGYQLILDDWILWQPDSSGLFRPNNLRKVWSRGLEISSKWQVASGWYQRESLGVGREGRWKIDLSGRLQLSRTTNVAVYGGSENALGRQLPYTPNISGGLSLNILRGRFSAAYFQQFTGQRLDNAANKIAAFQIGNILTSYVLLRGHLNLDFRLENIWNNQYEIIRYRPMPGRSWKVGAAYRW